MRIYLLFFGCFFVPFSSSCSRGICAMFFFLNSPKNINNRKLLDAVMINSHKWKSTATVKKTQQRPNILWCARTKAIKNTHRFHNRNFFGFPIVFNRFERLFISSRALHTAHSTHHTHMLPPNSCRYPKKKTKHTLT